MSPLYYWNGVTVDKCNAICLSFKGNFCLTQHLADADLF